LLPDGITARLPLYHRGKAIPTYALVDAADAEWVNRWRWHLGTREYVRRRENGQTVYLHRELLGLPRIFDGRVSDHIDRVVLNCRRSNLRIVTLGGNNQNRSSNRRSSSAYRGVSWCKVTNKWLAFVKVNGDLKRLGRFASETEAAEVALAARRQLLPFSTD